MYWICGLSTASHFGILPLCNHSWLQQSSSVFLYQIWTHCSEALRTDTYSKVKKRQYYSVILNSRRKVRPNLTLWIIHLVPGRNFQKTKISYLLIPTPTCMYQGVGNRPPEISSTCPKIWVCGLRARRWKYVCRK